MLFVDNTHTSPAPKISQAGVGVMVMVFEHCEATPFKVVIRLMVNVPGVFGTATFSV